MNGSRENCSNVLRLLKDLGASLGWRYWTFVGAVLALGLVILLPPELFRFFTEHTHKLKDINASQFLIQLIFFGLVISVVLLVSALGRTFCSEWLRIKLEGELRRRMLKRLHHISLSALDSAQRGDWMSRMTEELSETEIFLTDVVPNQLRQLAVLLGAGLMFVAYSGWVALAVMSTALLMIYANFKVQARLAPVLARLRGLHGDVFQMMIETVEGIRTIRSQQASESNSKRFEKKLREIDSSSLSVVKSLGWLAGGTELAGQLLVTLCLTLAAWGLVRGGITVEQTLVYPFFIGLFYSAAQSVAGYSYQWNRFLIEGGRVADLLYSVPEEKNDRGELRTSSSEVDSLRLNGIQLGLGHTTQLLAGPFDFSLERGKLLAVMGPSGGGKSTLLEVIAGLRRPLGGESATFDAKGNQLGSFSASELLPSRLCSYVDQRPFLFEGTLRENLVICDRPAVPDALLWAQLERVGLHAFALKGDGLDTRILDRGSNLSEGERYRVALCRALCLERPFLLLDEPFAALDRKSVDRILSVLRAQKWAQGIVVVTHFLPEGFEPDRIFDFETFHRITPSPRISLPTQVHDAPGLLV